jgi:hypothetical protein
MIAAGRMIAAFGKKQVLHCVQDDKIVGQVLHCVQDDKLWDWMTRS